MITFLKGNPLKTYIAFGGIQAVSYSTSGNPVLALQRKTPEYDLRGKYDIPADIDMIAVNTSIQRLDALVYFATFELVLTKTDAANSQAVLDELSMVGAKVQANIVKHGLPIVNP
jgi:hypothetical protein